MWLLIFFLTPIAEMYLLIEVGGYIGTLPTIALVMLTAVIGVGLLRVQGLATLTRGLKRLDGGQLPAREVVEGLLLAIAGALLLTPGFVTDTVGFLLLTPILRSRVADRVLPRVRVSAVGPHGFEAGSRPGSSSGFGAATGQAIEGEYQRIDDPEQPHPRAGRGPSN